MSFSETVSASAAWGYAAHGPSFHGARHEVIREICRAAGFSGIEAHAKMFPGFGVADFEREGRLYAEAGVLVSSFHLPYDVQYDLATQYETERRKTVAVEKTWLENAARLGARVAIVHPTTSRLDMNVESFDGFLSAFGRSLGELLPCAEACGVILAVENLPSPQGIRYGSAPEHFATFQKEFSHPFLGFCLDTGHALVSLHGRAMEIAEAMKPALAAFHLEDNAGDRDSHLAPGRGLVDWRAVSALLRDIQFTHPACVEAPPFAHGPNYSPTAWHDLHESTARLINSCLTPSGHPDTTKSQKTQN